MRLRSSTAIEVLEPRAYLSAALTTQLNINQYLSVGAATVTTTTADIGSATQIFDGDINTLLRTPAINPATVQLQFATAKTVRSMRANFAGGSNRWMVESANTAADLSAHTGSYRLLEPWTTVADTTYSDVTLATPATATLFKMTVNRLTGDNYVHIREWQLTGDVVINSMTVSPPAQTLSAGLTTQYTATGIDADGIQQPLSSLVTWSSSKPAVATINATGLATGVADGSTTIAATLSTLTGSTTLTVAADPVDLDVTYIERTPRYDYNATKNTPAVGDVVTFIGHIKNYGGTVASTAYRWEIDGASVSTGTLTNLTAGQERTLSIPWTTLAGAHQVKLIVDTANVVAESSEVNNAITIRTDALTWGLWVEQSMYNFFHQHQRDLGIGSNSWEDWAQRQAAKWNSMNAEAIWPNSPNGVTDRLRIDKIIIVPDGSLPLAGGIATNDPDLRDKTVDMMWGFVSSGLTGTFYADTTSVTPTNPFYLESGLLHETGHARYLVDAYGFDAHDTQVQVLEGGVRVAGTSRLPYLAYNEVLYYNQNGGLMGGPWPGWSPYEAGALNRIAGLRASQGNYNAPGNIGVFMNDLPTNNFVKFVDEAGQPITGAAVSVYRSTNANTGYYSHSFDNTVDLTYTTNSAGIIQMPRNPFTGTATLPGDPTVAVMLVRISKGANVWYKFMEATDFNMQYWAGNTTNANYTVELPNNGIISGPEIGLWGNEQPIPRNDLTPTVGDFTDFGSANLTNQSVTRMFVIKNTGSTNLDLAGGRVSISGAAAGDFTVTQMPSDSIGAGGLTFFRVTFDPSAPGVRNATVTVTSNDANEGSYAFAITGTSVANPAAPVVTSMVFNPRVKLAVDVTFSTTLNPASVTASDVVVNNLTNGQSYSAISVGLSSGNTVATFTLSSALPDGRYRFTLPAFSISSADAVSIETSTILQGNDVFVLTGDASHDGTVNFDDLLILARNYNQTGKTYGEGNFDFSIDGLVNFDDLLLLARKYNATLPPLAVAAAPKATKRRASAVSVVDAFGDRAIA